MGMYDTVYFEYRMPDGFDSGNYQTKDLDLELNEYEVSPAGRLLLIEAFNDNRPTGDVNFDGILNVYDSELDRTWHEYDLEFHNGDLVAIYCHQTGERHIFTLGFSPGAVAVITNAGAGEREHR
jgi:hypothetical protein